MSIKPLAPIEAVKTAAEVKHRLTIWNVESISNCKVVTNMFNYLPSGYSSEDFVLDLVVACIYSEEPISTLLAPSDWERINLTLVGMFVWSVTPQGYHFWKILNQEMNCNNFYNHRRIELL